MDTSRIKTANDGPTGICLGTIKPRAGGRLVMTA